MSAAQTFESIRVDAEVPAHVPKDRVVDISFAMGGMPNDMVDPYADSGWLAGPEIPRIMYNKPTMSAMGAAAGMSADGNFAWLEVECLGSCCNAPMAQINNDYYEDLTPESFGKLLDDLAAGRPVKVGPQNGRRGSEPLPGAKTLTDPTLYDGSVVGSWKARFEADEAKKAIAAAEAVKAAEAAKAAAAEAAKG